MTIDTAQLLMSAEFGSLAPAEAGGFLWLCLYASQGQGLPDDDQSLAQLSRLGAAWLEGAGKRIRALLETVAGKLVPKCLRKKNSEQRRQAARARWNGQLDLPDMQTDAKPTVLHDVALDDDEIYKSSKKKRTIVESSNEQPIRKPQARIEKPTPELERVREILAAYTGWGPPDHDICQQVLEAAGGDVDEVDRILAEKWERGLKPRGWGWFPTVVRVAYAGGAMAKAG